MRQQDQIFKKPVIKSQKPNLESAAHQEKQELHRGLFRLNFWCTGFLIPV